MITTSPIVKQVLESPHTNGPKPEINFDSLISNDNDIPRLNPNVFEEVGTVMLTN